MNEFYARKEVLDAIIAAWKANRSVALARILTEQELDAARREASYGWKKTRLPHMRSCEERPLRIPALAAFVKKVTGKRPVSGNAMRFSHRDYTILHDKDVQPPGVVALLFLDDWKEEWGGKVVFMRDGKTLESFMPRKNTLLIVERKNGTRHFVKYINHRAGKKRLTIIQG